MAIIPLIVGGNFVQIMETSGFNVDEIRSK